MRKKMDKQLATAYGKEVLKAEIVKELLKKKPMPFMSIKPLEKPIWYDQSDYYIDLGKMRALDDAITMIQKL